LKKLAVIITTPPYSNLTVTALNYVESALISGISVIGVFFYQDGALHANRNISIASDEYQSIKHWENLHKKYHLPLHICISAADKRGAITDSEQNPEPKSGPFTISGLGELVSLVSSATRVIQF